MPSIFLVCRLSVLWLIQPPYSPVFVVSTVLLIASPPALTLAQITQSTSGESEAYERLLSKTMFWTYCVLTPLSMIVFAIIGLFISKQ